VRSNFVTAAPPLSSSKPSDFRPRLACVLILLLSLCSVPAFSAPDPQPPTPNPSSPKLTDEQVEAAMEFLRIRRPSLAEKLDAMNAEERRTNIARIAPRLRFWMDLKSRDPEAFDLYMQQSAAEAQMSDLARRLKDAPAAEADGLKAELHTVAEKHFESRHKILAREITRLESRIQQIRDEVKQAQANQPKLIEERFQKTLAAPPPADDDKFPSEADPGRPRRPHGDAPRLDKPEKIEKPDHPDHPPPAKFTDEQADAVLDIVRARRPGLAQKLAAMSPEDRRADLARLLPRMRGLLEMKRRDPDGFALLKDQWTMEAQAADLARKVHAGTDAEKNKAALHDVVAKQFEQHFKLLDHETAQLEKRISQVRADIKTQQATKQQLIDQRIQHLLAAPPPQPEDTLAPRPE
jgi:hypothetical protein